MDAYDQETRTGESYDSEPPRKRFTKTDEIMAKASKPIYTERGSRISKENLCMVLALWMEQFPLPKTDLKDSHRKVGAVLVLPNDMLHAVDCSRDGVHGVARLLIKHHDVAKDGKVFVSRKPCSFCTKLLVQSKVKRVFYLPIEPEYLHIKRRYRDEKKLKDETSRVDSLFKTSAISQSVFVPAVGKDVFENAEEKHETPRKTRVEKKRKLLRDYWSDEWMEKAKDDLPWPALDNNMKKQVRKDFEDTMEWMARLLIEGEKGYTFKARNETGKSFNPETNQGDKKASERLITLAKLLAERSDDPKTGVGAVITKKHDKAFEILALGWNGFPTKALYGEFPRASHDDQVEDKKYPYMIHAEQNALLMRNTKNLTDGILFVTKTPCDECTPLLKMEGIKTVVLGEELKSKTSSAGNLNYTEFGKKVDNGVFTCFEMRAPAKRTSRKLDLEPKSKKSKK